MDLAGRIEKAFSHFGDSKYFPMTFSNGRFEGCKKLENYASVEIVTKKKIAEGLDDWVNSRLNEKNGYSAFLRLVAISTESRENFKYIAEIVPFENLSSEKKQEETKRFLRSLPNLVIGFRLSNPNRRKR